LLTCASSLDVINMNGSPGAVWDASVDCIGLARGERGIVDGGLVSLRSGVARVTNTEEAKVGVDAASGLK
jgi:hypothetical protein